MVKYTIVTWDNCQTIYKPAKWGLQARRMVYTSTWLRPKSGTDRGTQMLFPDI